MQRVVNCLLAVLLLGCQTAPGEARHDDIALRIVVADEHIREEGVECAGRRPYLYVRAGAAYTLETADGTVLAQGELPPGSAENAYPDIDWSIRRIPTVCAMDLIIRGVPEHPAYQVRLERGPPLRFDASQVTDGGDPVVLVVR